MPLNRQRSLNSAFPAARDAKLGDVLADLIAGFNAHVQRINSVCLSSPGLVISAGGATVAKAGSAFTAVAGGVLLLIAANTNMPALAGVIATTKFAGWAFYVDSTGTLSVSAKTADAATLAAAVALIPAPPAGLAMIGFIVVQNGAGGNFTGGTTALDAASTTTTYYNTAGTVMMAGTVAGTTLTDLEHR